MGYQELINQLWQQYSAEIDAARKIHDLFEHEGETVVNDHIALRTFDDPRVDVDTLAVPFLKAGYVEKDHYNFPNKHLFAKYYVREGDPAAPKIFISELITHQFSEWLQDEVESLLETIPEKLLSHPDRLICSGTSWGVPRYAIYEKLLAESQYAAWMYAFGYRANHFTVSVNHLRKYPTIERVNGFLKQHGFVLNSENGEVKGTVADRLQQSSTMAEKKAVQFQEGVYEIPSCYYEFALRFPDTKGELYQGFVPASADKIFESTDFDPTKTKR